MTWKEKVEEVLSDDRCDLCEILAIIARMMAEYMDHEEVVVCPLGQAERTRQLQQLGETVRELTKPMEIDVKVNVVSPTDNTEAYGERGVQHENLHQ